MAEPRIALFVMNPERDRCWLAAYTRSRHESQVASQLSVKGVVSLFPTYNKLKRFRISPQGDQA